MKKKNQTSILTTSYLDTKPGNSTDQR